MSETINQTNKQINKNKINYRQTKKQTNKQFVPKMQITTTKIKYK